MDATSGLARWTRRPSGRGVQRPLGDRLADIDSTATRPYATNANTSLITQPDATKLDFTGRLGCTVDYQLQPRHRRTDLSGANDRGTCYA